MGRARRWRLQHLPSKLRKIRDHLSLSQTELVKELGMENVIYRHTISGYESGDREPPLPILLAYAKLVGISTDELIDDSISLKL